MGMENDLKKVVPVSVIIPCYNAATTIERAVASVIEQTVLPQEVIIVDDRSSDDSWTVLKDIKAAYKNIIKLIIIRNAVNVGAGQARNYAWDKAKGKYLAFLDADDAWFFNKLEVQFGIMENSDDIDISCHKMILDENKDDDENYRWFYVNKYRALFKNQMMTPSVMLKRSIPYRFKTDKRYAEDTSLWCELLFNNYRVVYIDRALARVFKPFYGSSGLSGRMLEMEKGELKNFIDLYNKNKLPLVMFVAVYIFSIIKYIRRVIKVRIRSWS